MTGQAQSNGPISTVEAEQEIRRINEEWVSALIRGDTATLNRLMADDCVFTYALEGDDKAQFISDIETGDLIVDVLNRDNVEVRIYGRTGVLVAFDTAGWKYKGRNIKGHYRTLHVYSELEGLWQIVAIQSSPISLK
jgi:ketosteroid isomerase-like protein